MSITHVSIVTWCVLKLQCWYWYMDNGFSLIMTDSSHYLSDTLKRKGSRTKNSILNGRRLIRIARIIMWVISIDLDINTILIVLLDSSTLKPHSLSRFTLREYKNIPFSQSISWMLSIWRRQEPGHQQVWYWPSLHVPVCCPHRYIK